MGAIPSIRSKDRRGTDEKLGAPTLLSVRTLMTEFRTQGGKISAVAGVSFEIAKGETLGSVGGSGCGKTVTALSIMRLT